LTGFSTVALEPSEAVALSALAVEAAERGMTVDAPAAEIIAERVEPQRHRLSVNGLGASTSSRHARDDEAMLAEDLGRDSRH
jgi:hypothetical protein